MLRKPEFFDTIKTVYVPAILPELEPKHPAAPTVNGSKPTEDQLTATTTSSVFPMVQPLRAALHFDSPEGFGEWRIMIPSSAHRGLRDARKRNPKLFDIIIKKIKSVYILRNVSHFTYTGLGNCRTVTFRMIIKRNSTCLAGYLSSRQKWRVIRVWW